MFIESWWLKSEGGFRLEGLVSKAEAVYKECEFRIEGVRTEELEIYQ
jgi:hypothetical protein